MQFNNQQNWYKTAYPDAQHQVILCDGQPIGRILVDRTPEFFLLVDIALLPEHQKQGIGTNYLLELLDEAKRAGVPVRLQVLKNNPAQRLYERLGFVKTGEDELYLQMEWS